MKTALIGIVLLILVALGVYFFGHKKAVTPGEAATGQTVTYYCANNKTIDATFATSSVALTLSDGRSLTLPQTISGSGIRYEASTTNSNTVFGSEGDNGFLLENGKATFDMCTAATVEQSDAPGYETYTDPSKTFTFAFPSNFSVTGTNPGFNPGWSAPATTSGMVLAKVVASKDLQPNTNFVEAWFTVGASSDPSAVATCYDTLSGTKSTTTPVTIGGTQFKKLEFTGVGAGNIYDTTSYRTVRGNECYAIEYTIHSANIQNYPKGSVQPFDEAKVTAALEEIASSFRFLK